MCCACACGGLWTDRAATQTYTLTAKQTTPTTPGQSGKAPVLIPLAVGLLGPDGELFSSPPLSPPPPAFPAPADVSAPPAASSGGRARCADGRERVAARRAGEDVPLHVRHEGATNGSATNGSSAAPTTAVLRFEQVRLAFSRPAATLAPHPHPHPADLRSPHLTLRYAGGVVARRLAQAEQQFVFEHVPSEPVPSVLRGFSAPVRLEVQGQTDDHLIFLFANDSDPFNRCVRGARAPLRRRPPQRSTCPTGCHCSRTSDSSAYCLIRGREGTMRLAKLCVVNLY